jgi:poly(3-hydroxybutyrate) depolymerase
MKRRASLGASLAVAVAVAATPTANATPTATPTATSPSTPTPSEATRIELQPSPAGWLGAWLVLGPYHSPLADEAKLRPKLGASMGPPFLTAAEAAKRGAKDAVLAQPPRWTLASSGEGAIDLRAAVRGSESDVMGYAAGQLHLEEDARVLLLLGADDGVRVLVDGKSVYAREESRPQRDDDDVVPLDLAKGDHAIVLALHQRDAGWALHARILDAASLEPPEGSYLALPGTTADDAKALAAKMSWVSVDRGLAPDGYHPRLTVRFPEGAPRSVPLRVRARLVKGPVAAKGAAFDPALEALFDVGPLEVPRLERSVGELVATLPALDDGAPLEGDLTYEVGVAERRVTARFSPRKAIQASVARAASALAATPASAPWLRPGSLESVRHIYDRVVSLGSHSDTDLEGQLDEAKELDQLARALEQGTDPYASRTGPMRRAYASPIDGELAEYGLYVPPSYKPGTKRRWPLVVGLHGLNGRPVAMIRYLFGFDDPKKENEWEDRHLGVLPPLDAFVVTPHGHGNTMYRDQGEDDVMRVIDWALAAYPIDPDRVTITGMSMGGIGSAAVAFRHPDRFAAAEPLCGYHSYFVRRDISGRPIRPWEKLLAEERSNAFWAWNGQHLPLYIVHGTLDQPEENSGVLIKRYEELGYSVEHEHPVLGHNVWQTTYEGFKGIDWLLPHRREAHPAEVRLRTVRLRDGDDAWLHIDELAAPDVWGEVTVHMHPPRSPGVTPGMGGTVTATTRGVNALHIDRDAQLTDPHGALTVVVDGATLHFAAEEPAALHKEAGVWTPGAPSHAVPWKHGEVTGPIRDAYHAPLLFVYGADDPSQTRANEEVARAWALDGSSIAVHYPVMTDEEFLARGEPLANDRALFLVGNARSNRLVRALEPELPIKVFDGAILVGGERIEGRELGAAFVRPNPRRPDRYLVVVEGVSALGTWRSLSLPSLLPDFVVYDADLAPSRGQMLIGAGSVRAGGFFQNDWALPATFHDPLAQAKRAAAKSEYEATPYLP